MIRALHISRISLLEKHSAVPGQGGGGGAFLKHERGDQARSLIQILTGLARRVITGLRFVVCVCDLCGCVCSPGTRSMGFKMDCCSEGNPKGYQLKKQDSL